MFFLLLALLALAVLVALAFSRQFYDPRDPMYAAYGFMAPQQATRTSLPGRRR